MHDLAAATAAIKEDVEDAGFPAILPDLGGAVLAGHRGISQRPRQIRGREADQLLRHHDRPLELRHGLLLTVGDAGGKKRGGGQQHCCRHAAASFWPAPGAACYSRAWHQEALTSPCVAGCRAAAAPLPGCAGRAGGPLPLAAWPLSSPMVPRARPPRSISISA